MNNEIYSSLLSVNISSLGAELQSINYNGKEVLWQGDEKIWKRRSPLLFPIVGRLLDDKLKFENREYILEKHGFARMLDFDAEQVSDSKVTYLLKSNKTTRSMYPFDFELRVTYFVDGSNLNVLYDVLNTGIGAMYFSIGGHPGFNCRMGDKIIFEKKETADRLVMNKDSYISDKIPFLINSDEIQITESLFEEDALIFDNIKSEYLTLKTCDFDIKVTFGKPSHLGIWAKPNAPYVCIEPWFGVDDSIDANCSFDKKYAIIKLEKNCRFNYSFDIDVINK